LGKKAIRTAEPLTYMPLLMPANWGGNLLSWASSGWRSKHILLSTKLSLPVNTTLFF